VNHPDLSFRDKVRFPLVIAFLAMHSGDSAGACPPRRTGIGSTTDSTAQVIWMTCYRQRVAHAVPADVHSPAYHAHGLIDAVCERVVYPLRVTETGSRHCKQCTEKLTPRTSGDTQ
jgi:hypothetical protein